MYVIYEHGSQFHMFDWEKKREMRKGKRGENNKWRENDEYCLTEEAMPAYF